MHKTYITNAHSDQASCIQYALCPNKFLTCHFCLVSCFMMSLRITSYLSKIPALRVFYTLVIGCKRPENTSSVVYADCDGQMLEKIKRPAGAWTLLEPDGCACNLSITTQSPPPNPSTLSYLSSLHAS